SVYLSIDNTAEGSAPPSMVALAQAVSWLNDTKQLTPASID
ncbi:MAG: hypothetical protein JWQ33_1459, partial [Ramlibacter sp.]|nr:hypothetical protein [Ramlibacter sp.]